MSLLENKKTAFVYGDEKLYVGTNLKLITRDRTPHVYIVYLTFAPNAKTGEDAESLMEIVVSESATASEIMHAMQDGESKKYYSYGAYSDRISDISEIIPLFELMSDNSLRFINSDSWPSLIAYRDSFLSELSFILLSHGILEIRPRSRFDHTIVENINSLINAMKYITSWSYYEDETIKRAKNYLYSLITHNVVDYWDAILFLSKKGECVSVRYCSYIQPVQCINEIPDRSNTIADIGDSTSGKYKNSGYKLDSIHAAVKFSGISGTHGSVFKVKDFRTPKEEN